MRILITGGTGFVGRQLVAKLIQNESYKVSCLIRPDSKNKKNLEGLGAELCFAHLRDGATLAKIVSNKNVVIHLAGSIFSENKSELYLTNQEGTATLYSSLKDSTVSKFIFLSSIAAVGPQKRGVVLTEETKPTPKSAYGDSKLGAEKQLEALFQSVQKKILIIRAPLIYGRGLSGESRLCLLIDRIQSGQFKYLGNGENKITFCAVENLVQALETSIHLNTGCFNTLHIADPLVLSFRNLVGLIYSRLGISENSRKIYLPIARLITAVTDLWSNVSGAKYYLTQERLNEIVGEWNMSIEKANTLGIKTIVDPKSALVDVIDWHITRCR